MLNCQLVGKKMVVITIAADAMKIVVVHLKTVHHCSGTFSVTLRHCSG
jgi:hypothetical protein